MKPPWHLASLFHFPFQLCSFEMFFEKMENACWVQGHHHPGSGDGSGSALGVPSTKPRANSSHPAAVRSWAVLAPGFPGKAWVEEAGAGKGPREYLVDLMPPPSPWAPREGATLWTGVQGIEGWNPEKRVEGMTAVTAIVSGQTDQALVQKLFGCWPFLFRCLHAGSAFDKVWFANMSMICMCIFGCQTHRQIKLRSQMPRQLLMN